MLCCSWYCLVPCCSVCRCSCYGACVVLLCCAGHGCVVLPCCDIYIYAGLRFWRVAGCGGASQGCMHTWSRACFLYQGGKGGGSLPQIPGLKPLRPTLTDMYPKMVPCSSPVAMGCLPRAPRARVSGSEARAPFNYPQGPGGLGFFLVTGNSSGTWYTLIMDGSRARIAFAAGLHGLGRDKTG